MKFGFIAHPVGGEEMELFKVIQAIRGFPLISFFHEINSARDSDAGRYVLTFSDITSLDGSVCTGKIQYLSMPPRDILDKQTESVEKIIETCRELVDWGADIIGLGGYTGIVGSRGLEAAQRLPVPVTTGNSYTVYSTIEVLETTCLRLGIHWREEEIVIIGIPGSIGLALVRMLLGKGAKKLVLVGRRAKNYLAGLVNRLGGPADANIVITDSVEEGIQQGKIILSVTSAGNIIHQGMLQPGSVVIDIAYPKDVIGDEPERSDVLILDGGRFNLRPEVTCKGFLGRFLRNNLHSCFGETILLAWENRKECFSLGREIPVEKVEEIGRLSMKHGFTTESPYSFGKPLRESIPTNIRKVRFRNEEKKSRKLVRFNDAMKSSNDDVFQRYGSYINPVVATMSKLVHFDKHFVRGAGLYLWDDKGDKYYDFVAGYGSVNIGHNSPRVVDAAEKFYQKNMPSLVQASPGCMTTALAENLALITPENLEISFFCNSGTEANEGALKLARAAGQKTKILYTENSFHGKTFGSLSVTGRSRYQKPFGPLLPGCVSVPYGEIESLEDQLKNRDVAAFIVEPIQGEGGIIVPPPGYLKTAEELCRKYGAFLILDEIQTGFGRTGRMFAAEHENVQPDIITLAKSLGGGMVPIGVYITTREIWEKAYGSYDRCLLHTSTFGGNNFSSAVALAGIETIFEENLVHNALTEGAYFFHRLDRLKERYSFISDVRGKGLMLGIQFDQPLNTAWLRMRNELLSMVTGEMHSVLNLISLDLRRTIENSLYKIDESLQEYFMENLCYQVSVRMLREHNILSLVTLNNPKVMRVQPPLCINREQVDYFVDSLDKVCRGIDTAT